MIEHCTLSNLVKAEVEVTLGDGKVFKRWYWCVRTFDAIAPAVTTEPNALMQRFWHRRGDGYAFTFRGGWAKAWALVWKVEREIEDEWMMKGPNRDEGDDA